MLRRRNTNVIAILLLAFLAIASFSTIIPVWAFIAIVIIWFLITLCGSFFIQWNYHLNAAHANQKTKLQQLAFTFDDGPHPEFTPQVLALLKAHQAKATFFCIGKQAEKHPEIVKQIIAEGHTIGNHTYSHTNSFGFLSTENVVAELQKANQIISGIIGKKLKLYRPAFGVTNPMIARAVSQLQLTAVGWNVRSLDTTARTKKMILKRITPKLVKGNVILLHDTSAKTVAVLERLLLFLQEKNLASVTVDQLLEIEAYE